MLPWFAERMLPTVAPESAANCCAIARAFFVASASSCGRRSLNFESTKRGLAAPPSRSASRITPALSSSSVAPLDALRTRSTLAVFTTTAVVTT